MTIEHHFSDGVYAKEISVCAGEEIFKHRHDSFSHLSILAAGSVDLYRMDMYKCTTVVRLEAPCCVEIPKGEHHRIVAVTDCVWYCIHATEEKSVAKIDSVLISKPDYRQVAVLMKGVI